MADIKTRDTVKGTIRTLNKAKIASSCMKSAYIQTKDRQLYYAAHCNGNWKIPILKTLNPAELIRWINS